VSVCSKLKCMELQSKLKLIFNAESVKKKLDFFEEEKLLLLLFHMRYVCQFAL
jgi:hypothetical protein